LEAVIHQLRLVSRLLLTLSAFLVCGVLSAQQSSKESSVPPHAPNTKSPSLKICLRLLDDSAFSGLVNLRVASAQGSDVAGKATDSEGETIFSDLAPGSYSVDANAPGLARTRPRDHVPGHEA